MISSKKLTKSSEPFSKGPIQARLEWAHSSSARIALAKKHAGVSSKPHKYVFMNSVAQISLELLLLTAAFLSVLALFLPVFQTVFSGGQLGLESLKAQSFADSFQQKTALLNVLGNGSEFALAVSPSRSWTIRLNENRFELVFFESEEKEKRFERELAFFAIPTELFFSESVKIVLQKKNGQLIVHVQED